MLPALIQLCVLAIVLCVAAEPFRRSSHAGIQKFSKDLAAAKRPVSRQWGKERAPMVPHSVPGPSTAGQDVRLLDIVLAASVDGHFHALNRTTGELIWSMADDLAYVQSPRDPNTESAPHMASQSPLYNLVRSDHRSLVDSDQMEEEEESYVIEPQTGEVFVLHPDDTPVERLGYSVPQLVELSPFKPPGDDERVFYGRKTTSLISIDLLTGRILGVYGERCTWDDNQTVEDNPVDVNAMLDDLDGTQELPQKQRPIEVIVGRTDYHVSIHVKGRGVVQNLEFTKYGPNNVHRNIQAAWTRSPDSTYFQPSPDGKLYSFAKGGLLSYVPTYPLIVAVFDAVYLPTRRDPILLLQPIPKLSDLSSSRSADMDIPEVTYIGRIDDSLFALGHTTYPLVSFAQVGKKQLPRIDDGGKTPHSHSSPDPNASVERCYDLDCLTGTKWGQPARRSGLNRLIEEEHILAIEGSAGVEDPPEDYHEIPQSKPDPPRTRAQPQKPQTLAPRPTRTTNSTSHTRPVIEDKEDKTPHATPSPRTGIRSIAREWLAAWASMGGVVLSTVMFGLGLGVRRGKWSVAGILFKLLPASDDKTSEPTPIAEEDEEDETPPPVPPKPYSISRITQNPYLMTTDSRPGVPLKDTPATPPRKRIRPRMRGGVPSSASVPVLPTVNPAGQLVASKSAGDVNVVEEPESNVEDRKPEPENTETEVEGPVEEANTPGKKRVRRGRRGKGRGKGASTGDAGKNGVETEGVLSEGSESFVRVEKTIVPPKSSYGPDLKAGKVESYNRGINDHIVLSAKFGPDVFVWIWWFDRQGVIQSTGINFIEDLPRFLVFLFCIQRFTYSDWGFDLELDPSILSRHISDKTALSHQVRLELDGKDGKFEVHFEHDMTPLYDPFALGSKATKVFDVANTSVELPLVAKLYWPNQDRPHEAEIIDRARKVKGLEDHLPLAVARRDINSSSTKHIRDELGLTNSPRRPRLLRILVFEKLFDILQRTGDQFIFAWLECVRAHYLLWEEKICHLDLSLRNLRLRIRQVNGELKHFGVLNDWDLGDTEGERLEPRKDLMKTILFTSLDLLRLNAPGVVEQRYYHDIESFLWIMIWVFLAVREQEIDPVPAVASWRTGDALTSRAQRFDFLRMASEYGPHPEWNDYWRMARPIAKWMSIHLEKLEDSRSFNDNLDPQNHSRPSVNNLDLLRQLIALVKTGYSGPMPTLPKIEGL
ncbi:unnamed protein product [Rhizoctonia solani]|uniref:Fungal-type protein kinase domain-containing protein n=1 Tax=Rhizoctonia solani TaxID=456999 RepID=A0A8H3DS39_9AGAM|nr:unnamed protein product [Rhizoctonia solani]